MDHFPIPDHVYVYIITPKQGISVLSLIARPGYCRVFSSHNLGSSIVVVVVVVVVTLLDAPRMDPNLDHTAKLDSLSE